MANTELKNFEKTFTESEYGQTLGANIRYGKYKPEEMTNEAWVELLGRDVSNLQHLSLTRGIATAFVRHSTEHQPELLTADEGQMLELTAQVHDWGEALTGDISYGDKNADDDEIEKDAFEIVASRLYADEPEKLEQLKQARDIALTHEGGKLNEIFFAIECLGYFRTALRASELALDESLPEALRARLVWLTTDVISNVSIKMLAFAEKYKAIEAAVAANSEVAEQAFELIAIHDDTVYGNYGERALEKRQAVSTARNAWHAYAAPLF